MRSPPRIEPAAAGEAQVCLGHTGAEDELGHRTREEVEVAQIEAGGRNAQVEMEQQLAARQWTQHEGLRCVRPQHFRRARQESARSSKKGGRSANPQGVVKPNNLI
jgi:endonuclease YncB( thermonuclease family)